MADVSGTVSVASSVELAVVERSGFVESRHAGAAIVFDPEGVPVLTLGDVETAIGIMRRHRALEDTVERARHYGAMARDALALFPKSPMKQALLDTVDFCIARTH